MASFEHKKPVVSVMNTEKEFGLEFTKEIGDDAQIERNPELILSDYISEVVIYDDYEGKLLGFSATLGKKSDAKLHGQVMTMRRNQYGNWYCFISDQNSQYKLKKSPLDSCKLNNEPFALDIERKASS